MTFTEMADEWLRERSHRAASFEISTHSHEGAVPKVEVCKAPVLSKPTHEYPQMQGIRIIRWEPVAPPVQLDRWSVVVDARAFASNVLLKIEALLRGEAWKAGNWTLAQLVGRLEAVGVMVEIENASPLLQ